MQPQFFRLALPLCAIMLLSACASGPQLEKYPRRQIDRPYTLPKGVANWQPVLNVESYSIQSVDSGQTGFSNIDAYWDPFVFQHSLSDDWNLLWTPMPNVLHQFAKTKTDMIGFTAGVQGFLESSINGFFLTVGASFLERHYFSDSFALDISPSFNEEIAFQDGEPSTWVAGFSISPLFQVTEVFSLQPSLGLSWNHGNVPGFVYFGSSDLFPTDTTQFTLPLSLTGSWSISRRWDLTASYAYYGIGYSNDFKSQVGTVGGAYYW